MGALWGSATEIKDLGVVAEQCPYCEQMMPCFVRAVWQVDFVCFLRINPVNKETNCLCPVCGGSFPCQLWRYRELVPVQEAPALGLAKLLARTNPGLAERVQLKQQVSSLGGDACFTAAYEQLEAMRPGELHSGLLKQLLDWGRLDEKQRADLVQRIAGCAAPAGWPGKSRRGSPVAVVCRPSWRRWPCGRRSCGRPWGTTGPAASARSWPGARRQRSRATCSLPAACAAGSAWSWCRRRSSPTSRWSLSSR